MQLIQSLARGGAEHLALELSMGLRDAGHEVLVVTLQGENAHDEPEYATVEKRSLIAGESFLWPWYLPRAAFRLSALLRAWKPDLVFTHTQNIAVAAALATTRPRVVQIFHSYWEAMGGTPAQQWRRRMLAQWTFGRLGRRGVVAWSLVENSVRHLDCSRIDRCAPANSAAVPFRPAPAASHHASAP
jgi:hypothetical protein